MHRFKRLAAAAGLLALASLARADDAALTVCMAEDNPPLSRQAQGEMQGLDVRIARAVAAELGRPLSIVPFESEYEAESTLSQEVNALLSSGVCQLASGFALIGGDLGAPVRPTARVPDYPGAKRRPLRPWVKLGTLVPSRAYHAMAMGLVVRDALRAGATLADPGDARIGVVSGTLAGTAATLFRNGKLRPQLVSVAQNEDVLELLEAGRFDAALVPLDRLDAWRLAHPGTPLRRTPYLHPYRINLGFVGLAGATAELRAADRVIARALDSGELRRWCEETGTTWVAPVEPQVTPAFSFPDLLRE
ncbi:MAG TPA: transporter substrate-binding domain-containing protein [Ideonella sp.]|nr:transporter substrate-binding domain-containing protein [Ideonella sp.]